MSPTSPRKPQGRWPIAWRWRCRRGWTRGLAGRLCEGLRAAQAEFGIALCGGDTTVSPAGPLMISVTAFGTVPRGAMVRRGGARPGDALYVSGTIGDAALGLRLRRSDADTRGWPLDDAAASISHPPLSAPGAPIGACARRCLLMQARRWTSPTASSSTAPGCAAASGADGRIEARLVPLSPAAQTVTAADPAAFERALTGGDDYEILAAIRPGEEAAFEAGALPPASRSPASGR